MLAHEFKSPINAIEGFLNLLSDPEMGISDEERVDLLSRSKKRMHFMRKMIADLLDLTRIESGQKSRELVEINLHTLTGQVMENYGLEAKKRKISLRHRVSKSVNLLADRDELEIILNNLVSNGVKYNKDGGEVNLEVSSDRDKLLIVVSDTGYPRQRTGAFDCKKIDDALLR